MALLRERQIPLTVCPLSNLKLCVIDDMKQHNIVELLNEGLLVTVNSDDPTYFGGFLNDNFVALQESLDIDEDTIRTLAANSFKSSFLPEDVKRSFVEKVFNDRENF